MVDRKLVYDSLCSIICSIISIIGLFYAFEFGISGDLILFWVSIVIWVIILIISLTFMIWTLVEYSKNL
jgi:hypothetical protein